MQCHSFVERKFILFRHKMRFFLDENLPLSLLFALHELGFQAEHVKTVALQGHSDVSIAEYAKRHKAVLITKDLEFGSPLLYSKSAHYGVMILRLPHYFNAGQITDAVVNFLKIIKIGVLVNAVTVLEVGRYRMRRIS